MRRPILHVLSIAVSMALMFRVAGAASPDFVPASARISGCSATMVASEGKFSYGVSAAHCAPGVGMSTKVDLPSGKEGSAVWVYIDRTVDMSLFRCPTSQIDSIYPVKLEPKLEKFVSCGYPKGKGPFIIASKFKGLVTLTNFDAVRWEFGVKNTRFNKGCSGGGVFADGSLVGVMSHGNKDNDEMFSSTHDQLVGFLKDAEKKLGLSLLSSKKAEVGGFEFEGIPLGSDVDRTKAIVHILSELKRRGAELERIKRTPIRVQILDPVTGKVLQEQAYPFGTPIKLLLPRAK